MKEFKQVRENLLEMLEDIDERLSKITDANVSDDDDDTTNTALNTTNSIYSDIKDIESALSKIDSGTYGICLSCGQAIKKEHLNTAPFSSFCQHCTEGTNTV